VHVANDTTQLYLRQIDVWNDGYVQSGRSVLLLRGCVSVRVVLIFRELASLPRLGARDLGNVDLLRRGGWVLGYQESALAKTGLKSGAQK
jgi:hypothetical protein